MDFHANAKMMHATPPQAETPDGQLFSIGTRVRVVDELPSFMRHFGHTGEIGTIEYSYAQKYRQFGMGLDSRSLNQYCVRFGNGTSAWWPAETLIETESREDI